MPTSAVVFEGKAVESDTRGLCSVKMPLRAKNAASLVQHADAVSAKFHAEVQSGKVLRVPAGSRPLVQAPLLAVVRPSEVEDAAREGRAPRARMCVGLHRGVNRALPK